ncbi:PotD/PotF family extracellular solute-binding protein [Halobacteriaceae archaeon GCM10025711]
MRRRHVLQTMAGAAGALGLAGCLGGGGGDGEDTTTTTASDGGDDEETTTADEGGDLADEVIVQMPGGSYVDAYTKHVFEPFEEEHDVTVKTTLFSDQFSGYSKIKAGQADVDVNLTSAATLYQGTQEGIWEPLDTGSLSNYGKLLDTFKNPIYDPGEQVHGIPAVYGTVGMAYNKDELGSLDSWAATWDSANKGRVTMEGFGFVRVFTTALYLGMDPNDIQVDGSYEKGIQKIWDSVRQQKDLVLTYWTSGDQQVRLYAQKQATVGEAWGGRIYNAVNEGYDFLDYVVPKEGAYGWSDNWAIVKDRSDKQKRTGAALLNYLLRDDVMQPLTEQLGYPPATGVTSEGIKNLYDYDPSGGDRLTFLNPGYKDEHNDAWSQTWEEIKSA